MTFKSALSATGKGLLNGASAIHNATINSQVAVINDEIEELERQLAEKHEQKDRLERQRTDYL